MIISAHWNLKNEQYYHHMKEVFIEVSTQEGCIIHQVIDIPVRAIPSGYAPDDFVHSYPDAPFCLIVLAQKQS
jgi:hypothetical protein